MAEVQDFSLGGDASRRYPDELAEAYADADDYWEAPEKVVLDESLDLHLVLHLLEPLLPEVSGCSATLHDRRRMPVPDREFCGGAIEKRKSASRSGSSVRST